MLCTFQYTNLAPACLCLFWGILLFLCYCKWSYFLNFLFRLFIVCLWSSLRPWFSDSPPLFACKIINIFTVLVQILLLRNTLWSPCPKLISLHLQSLLYPNSVPFSSVTQSYPTLCDPMNRSTPGLPVHHQLPEFTQAHVHWVDDAIQPSHPLSSPSPSAPNPSQHQSLFQWVNSSHEVAKVLEFQL